MRKALEFKVHGFEFDVQMSKDGEPVIIHDATLERTTNGKGNVCDYSLREIQELNAGGGEKIPSLRNVMDMVDKRCRLFIELKAENCTQAVATLIGEYVKKAGWSYEQFFVCSFDHFQIAAIRSLNSDIHTCALLAGIPIGLAAMAEEAGAEALNPCIHHISKALVDDAHKRKIKVYTWTCNTPHDIAKAKSLGVDGIVSDYPDRI